jgi:hypothetical protein
MPRVIKSEGVKKYSPHIWHGRDYSVPFTGAKVTDKKLILLAARLEDENQREHTEAQLLSQSYLQNAGK